MRQRTIHNLISAIVIAITTGALVLAMGSKTGMGGVAMASLASGIVAVTCIVIACIIWADRTSFSARYTDMTSDTASESGFIRSYRMGRVTKIAFIIFLLALVVILFGFSLSAGIDGLSFAHAYGIVIDHLGGKTFATGTSDWFHDILIWDSQLPRTIVAIIAGAGLAVGGAVMQGVVKNPLADPYTTGISSGAVLGATMAIVLGMTMTGTGQYGLILNAFVFSLIPAGIMIAVSRISSGSPATIILVGTAVSCIFSAFSTLIMMMADELAMKNAFVWTVGSLSGATWSYIPMMLIMVLAGSSVLFAMSDKMNLLMTGDDSAKAMGLDVETFRMVCLVILSLVTASIVSFIGLVGFLGLIAPHMVRLILGSDTRLVIPASAAMGAAFMLLADVISRILATGDMPVGVVFSFIGGPLFLLLIMRTRREAWQQ